MSDIIINFKSLIVTKLVCKNLLTGTNDSFFNICKVKVYRFLWVYSFLHVKVFHRGFSRFVYFHKKKSNFVKKKYKCMSMSVDVSSTTGVFLIISQYLCIQKHRLLHEKLNRTQELIDVKILFTLTCNC